MKMSIPQGLDRTEHSRAKATPLLAEEDMESDTPLPSCYFVTTDFDVPRWAQIKPWSDQGKKKSRRKKSMLVVDSDEEMLTVTRRRLQIANDY